MVFILALLVAVVVGAVAHNLFRGYGDLVRFAATVAGAIIGFWLTYYLVART